MAATSGISIDIFFDKNDCIPVDRYYMIQKAADVVVPAGLITAARVSVQCLLHVAGVLNMKIVFQADLIF